MDFKTIEELVSLSNNRDKSLSEKVTKALPELKSEMELGILISIVDLNDFADNHEYFMKCYNHLIDNKEKLDFKSSLRLSFFTSLVKDDIKIKKNNEKGISIE